MKQQVIGLQRVLQNRQKGFKWNNKKIRWSIVHNANNQTKAYDIELEMVLLSSKRILKVNQQVKNTQMCSFGYEVEFDISDKLKGYIKQDGIGFELYINGDSFTKLQQANKAYVPPKLTGSTSDSLQCNTHPNKQLKSQKIHFHGTDFKKDIMNKKTSSINNFNEYFQDPLKSPEQPNKNNNNLMKSLEFDTKSSFEQPSLQYKPVSQSPRVIKKQTQETIKDTQNQLIKILMEEKRRKRQEKLKKQVEMII